MSVTVDTEAPTDRELLIYIAKELQDIHGLLVEFKPMLDKLRRRGKLPPVPERNNNGR